MRKLYEIFKVLKIQKKSSFCGIYSRKCGKPELFIGVPADSSRMHYTTAKSLPIMCRIRRMFSLAVYLLINKRSNSSTSQSSSGLLQ